MSGTNKTLGGGGLHHVALKTTDWEGSLAFYCDVLGFVPKVTWTIVAERRAGMFDTGGGNYLEIFEDPDYTAASNGSLIHLAVRTHSVDETTARVRAAGMRITVEPKDVVIATTNGVGPVPVRLSFFEGPNGEVWELFENALT